MKQLLAFLLALLRLVNTVKAFPSKDYMKVALGVFGWTPDGFWQATPHEVRIAFDGWCEANSTTPNQQGMSRKSLEQLMQEYPDT